MEFVSLKESPRDGKRFVIKFINPKRTIHFGSDVGSTYIDHGDKIKRKNYLKRHEVRGRLVKSQCWVIKCLYIVGFVERY